MWTRSFVVLQTIEQGIEAEPEKIKAITEMPTPKDIADVESYVSYVVKFLYHITELTQSKKDRLKSKKD